MTEEQKAQLIRLLDSAPKPVDPERRDKLIADVAELPEDCISILINALSQRMMEESMERTLKELAEQSLKNSIEYHNLPHYSHKVEVDVQPFYTRFLNKGKKRKNRF